LVIIGLLDVKVTLPGGSLVEFQDLLV